MRTRTDFDDPQFLYWEVVGCARGTAERGQTVIGLGVEHRRTKKRGKLLLSVKAARDVAQMIEEVSSTRFEDN